MPPSDPYAQALAALDRGQGAEASSLLVRLLKRPGLPRTDQIQLRCSLAEAWLLQDDVRQATEALGRPPEARERLDPTHLSHLWRMHGRLAAARGEPSRGIAFLTKAVSQAERAHDSRAIGLAHYELGLCYRQVGDTAIVRDHITQAASALHAAGDRRHLAMVHSLSGITLAQEGRLDEAMAALRHAERLALLVDAGDVLATVCGNQANVALMQHRHEQALTLAERSVELQQEAGTPHGLGVALASLGQICVRLGNLKRAEEALNRALDVRSPQQFMRETTGAVFDTLAQIHSDPRRVRGREPLACRRRARPTANTRCRRRDGTSGRCTCSAPGWPCGGASTVRRCRSRPTIARAPEAPPGVRAPGRAHCRRGAARVRADRERPGAPRLDWRAHPARLDERHVGRVAAAARPAPRRQPAGSTDAYHDFGQSVSVFELLGEKHQAGLSYLELGRLSAAAGAGSRAARYLGDAATIFESAWRDARPRRGAAGAVAAAAARQRGGVRRRPRRRRCHRPATGGCRGAAGAAGARGRDRAARGCATPKRPSSVCSRRGRPRVVAAAGCDADARPRAGRDGGARPAGPAAAD